MRRVSAKETNSMNLTEPKLEPDDSVACCYSTEPLSQLLKSRDVLAVVSPSEPCEPGNDPRCYGCGLPSLTTEIHHEVWYSSGPVQTGIENGCHWSQNDEMLFAGLWVDESDFDSQHEAVYHAYNKLLSFIAEKGFPKIVRAWNYIPDINNGEGNLERYRQFCSARALAFTDCHYDWADYPSACAIGHRGDKSVIYFLSGKASIVHIENPRQKSAYHYPPEYGPASPSFARASLARWRSGSQLYISGTASIIGHKSYHRDDLNAQLQTTFDNIDTLLRNSAHEAGLTKPPAMSLLKVYIREATDFPTVEQRVSQHFPGVPALYLQADICRSELLVEIDGLCDLDSSLFSQGATHHTL